MAGKGTNVGTAYIQVMPVAEGISDKIKKAINGESIGQGAGIAIGGSLVDAIGSIAKGLGDILTSSLDEGGKLQQSIGGVETLFGDMADTVVANANRAFETAGLSANEYMETVTSFSAALLQGLGGDTEKAASVADMALIDMADNANKFGSSMESIQSAYQGFAKQNYTMLDNLKLGYGGTKTEMQRLLADATKLTGVKYDMNNLSDVYEAIHVIQTELGVTGTTALEASVTFSGSMASMKAAWTNLLGGLTTGGDIGSLMTNLITTVSTFVFTNLLPMVFNFAKAIPEALFGTIDGLIPTIKSKFTEYWSNFQVEGFTAISNFIIGILNGLPDVITTLGNVLSSMVATIIDNFPTYMEKGYELILNVMNGLIQAFPDIVGSMASLMIELITTIASHLPEFLTKGIELVGQLVAGIIDAIPDLIATVPKMYNQMKEQLGAVDWLELGRNIVQGLADGVLGGLDLIGNACSNLANTAMKTIKETLGINSPSKKFYEFGRYSVEGYVNALDDNSHLVSEAMSRFGDTALNGALVNVPASLSAMSVNGARGGYVQNITINSPTELDPSEVARQTRNATRQMALAMRLE